MMSSHRFLISVRLHHSTYAQTDDKETERRRGEINHFCHQIGTQSNSMGSTNTDAGDKISNQYLKCNKRCLSINYNTSLDHHNM